MGELGLFYRLATFTFVGGSLVRHGGQNPLEPATLGCAVLAGPHTFNFASAYEAIFRVQEKGRVATTSEIAALAGVLLANPAAAHTLGNAAAAAAQSLSGAVAKTFDIAEKLLANART